MISHIPQHRHRIGIHPKDDDHDDDDDDADDDVQANIRMNSSSLFTEKR